jgi:three-Cys-motif partner protein
VSVNGAARGSLIEGDDGLPVRVVGPWVNRKVYYVDRAADILTRGMSGKWRLAYVELFAGPGRSWDRGHHAFLDGSAIRALEKPFRDYVYVDIDPDATAALTERVRRRGGSAVIFTGDCNDVIKDVRARLPDPGLTLAFIDPTSWQIRFDTVEQLVADRRVDLLMTFTAGFMKRVGHYEAASLTAFFGTDEWRSALGRPRWERVAALVELYNSRLRALGYLPSAARGVTVRNTRGAPMYQLVLFSRNPRGIDFWEKAIGGPTETGQYPLPGFG